MECSGQWAVGSGQWAVGSGQWAEAITFYCLRFRMNALGPLTAQSTGRTRGLALARLTLYFCALELHP